MELKKLSQMHFSLHTPHFTILLHDLSAVHDINALLRRLAIQLHAIHRIPIFWDYRFLIYKSNSIRYGISINDRAHIITVTTTNIIHLQNAITCKTQIISNAWFFNSN